MRIPFIAGNWKMHKTVAESRELAQDLKTKLSGCTNKLMIAPPFTALQAVSQIVSHSNILLGAQNMAAQESGAHTGEVSVLMLKDLGVAVVILGHSERRLIYGESDPLINEKVRLALKHGLEVILCVGETLEQREKGLAESVVKDQVTQDLKGVAGTDLRRLTIAYEPVWAIGTGRTSTPQDADTIHAVIRKVVENLYDKDAAYAMVIQYGGSVKPDNIKGLMAMENIDGALVGGAALSADSFVPLADYGNY